MGECEPWIEDNTDAKLTAFENETLQFVLRNCCSHAINISIVGPAFQCWVNSTNLVIFTATLTWISLNASDNEVAVALDQLHSSKLPFSIETEAPVTVERVESVDAITVNSTASSTTQFQLATENSVYGFGKYWPFLTLGIIIFILGILVLPTSLLFYRRYIRSVVQNYQLLRP